MTNLAYKSGGLVMKSGGLGTSCECCDPDCPCTMTPFDPACDCCAITWQSVLIDGSYTHYNQLEFDSVDFPSNRRGPRNLTWQTGYPAALGCYFWWFSNVSCTSTDYYSGYDRSARYYRLFQCEGGVLVNRTNEAVVSGEVDPGVGVANVVSTSWGYALHYVKTFGVPPEDFDNLNGGCMTEVADIEPHLPELTC
jgi:hypothetical protein